jgi:type II secretory pathway component GspD/PulD (secretin)
VKLNHRAPSEVLPLARPLLGIADNVNATPDGSLKFAIDELGSRLLVTGKPERIEQLEKIIKLLDVNEASGDLVGGGPVEQPQLEIYPIVGADPQSVLNVIATLLVGQPNVRLAIDPKTNNLYAHGPPSVQATIRATLDQMQKDKRQFEVIKLRRADPQQVALTLNKLMGGTDEGPAANGPKIEADAINMQLHVRGTMNQIEQIRSFLEKMGEDGTGLAAVTSEERGNIRTIPLTGRAARTALDTLDQIWSTTHRNQIRVVTPSNLHQFTKPPADGLREPGRSQRGEGDLPQDSRPRLEAPPPPKKAPEGEKIRTEDRTTSRVQAGRFFFVSQPEGEATDDKKPGGAAGEKKEGEEEPAGKKPSVPGADIVVTLGPNGILIASEDTEALDEFEQLLRAIAETAVTKGREFNIFYLKYAKADAAAEILQEALGAKVVESGGGGGGGGLLGDMAANMLGGGDGGLIGGLLGLGGGGGGGSPSSSSSSSGAISILPDLRLNALIVQGSARDLDSIEHLLQVIDQPASPEKIETVRPPRMIPVVNTKAEDVAVMVREVYSNRIQAAPNQQRQPSPQELIQALRGGGRGGRGGGAAEKKNEEQKISVAVDSRSNSLIVSAPDHLFEEIRELVAVLDRAVEDTDQAVRVVTLSRASPDLVQRSITSVFGDTVTTSRTAGTTPTSNNNNSRSSSQSNQGRSDRQRSGRSNGGVDFQQMLNAAQGGRGRGGFGGGNFGGRGGGGRGGR